jgi:hypothetical protein
MKDLNEILQNIDVCIEELDLKKVGFIHERTEILDRLSNNYYWLTGHRDKAHKDWMSFYFNSKGNSSAAKEREADMKVPELYTIRHFMASTKLVIDSLRTSISANK